MCRVLFIAAAEVGLNIRVSECVKAISCPIWNFTDMLIHYNCLLFCVKIKVINCLIKLVSYTKCLIIEIIIFISDECHSIQCVNFT
jgi:hypothetical protein